MTDAFHPVFFELYESMPRQGPGSFEATSRAYEMCTALPNAARVLDLGCGTGKQLFDLTRLTKGEVLGLDAHAPFIAQIQQEAADRGLQSRVHAVQGDMGDPQLPPGSFDLVWSEGALYNIGIPAALQVIRPLLAPRGYLVFSDAVWRSDSAPESVRRSFADYPTMGTVDELLDTVRSADWELLGHFPLPDDAWWEHFYAPMEACIDALRKRYANDAESQAVLDELAQEPKMWREHGHHYGYEFVVARLPE